MYPKDGEMTFHYDGKGGTAKTAVKLDGTFDHEGDDRFPPVHIAHTGPYSYTATRSFFIEPAFVGEKRGHAEALRRCGDGARRDALHAMRRPTARPRSARGRLHGC
jgi:hypothetical protein